jgi:hypothetical protein
MQVLRGKIRGANGEGFTLKQRQRLWHVCLVRTFVTALVATTIVWAPPAVHAATTGVRCDELYNLKHIPPADPPLVPGVDDVWGNDDPPTYEYVNPGEEARLLKDETAAWQTDLRALLAKWGTKTRSTKANPKPSGSPQHVYASRLRYITEQLAQEVKPEDVLSWEQWLDSNYIPAQGNDPKGKSYERLIVEKYRLTGPDWICQETLPDAPNGRKYDAVNKKLKIALELKSGDREVGSQVTQDRENIKALQAKGENWRLHYSFGAEANEATLKRVTKESDGKITAKVVRADPVVTNAKNPPPGEAAKLVAPDPKTPARGAGVDFIENSPRNAAQAAARDAAYLREAEEAALDQAEAKAISEAEARAAALENARLRPGGVDFTTLELRYIAEDGPGVTYAFKGGVAADDVHSFGGLAAGQLSSDALFTWLALPASSFWVNLNPDQPDTIIDDKLGRTDAGRVLLQADLQMKKTSAKLLDPNTALGSDFWNSLQSKDENLPCITFRNWIVPGPAKVRENGGELYVLDAPLQVKSAPISFKTPIGGLPCPAQPESITQHNQLVYEQKILPKVEQAVNTAPEYQDLRRVYLARVMAEWLRQRSAAKANAFTPIIGSGDISRWLARTPWNPKDIFDQMVKSLRDGEYTYTWKRNQGGQEVTVTIVVGGVDFSESPRAPITETAFKQQYPALPQTVTRSRHSLLNDIDPSRTWLGAGAGPAAQAPAPPQASPPAAGSGGLPITGTPIALITLAGALLVIAGVAVLLWMRRRRTPIFRA